MVYPHEKGTLKFFQIFSIDRSFLNNCNRLNKFPPIKKSEKIHKIFKKSELFFHVNFKMGDRWFTHSLTELSYFHRKTNFLRISLYVFGVAESESDDSFDHSSLLSVLIFFFFLFNFKPFGYTVEKKKKKQNEKM